MDIGGTRRGARPYPKIMAVALALTLAFTALPGPAAVSAAPAPGSFTVGIAYSGNNLTVTWPNVPGAEAVRVTWTVPLPGGLGTTLEKVVPKGPDGNLPTGTDLGYIRADFVSEIEVGVYDEYDSVGDAVPATANLLRQGLAFFMSGVTFKSEALIQFPEVLPPGGKEIGSKPILMLWWNRPEILINGTAYYLDDDAAVPPPIGVTPFAYARDRMNAVYGGRYNSSTLNYVIRVEGSTGISATNIDISYDGLSGEYLVTVQGYEPAAGDPHPTVSMGATGRNSIYLFGKRDQTSVVPPTVAEYIAASQAYFDGFAAYFSDPAILAAFADHGTVHNGILAGTIYNMYIMLAFKNASGNEDFSFVTVGDPSSYGRSPVWQGSITIDEEVNYAYTPVYFRLTSDSFNNVYVDILKVNGAWAVTGANGMSPLYYEVQVHDTLQLGEWPVRSKIYDHEFGGRIGTTIISGIDPNSVVYYKIVVKSDSSDERIDSWYMDYRINSDPSKPGVPSNVEAHALPGLTRRAYPGVDPYDVDSGMYYGEYLSDVLIRWAKPDRWETVKDDMIFYFELCTDQFEYMGPTDAAYPLYANGGYYGSHLVRYRLVRFVDSAMLEPDRNDGYLYYVLKAEELFTGEFGTLLGGGEYGYDSVTLTSGDLRPDLSPYPYFLLPNTIYYLRMYAARLSDPGDPSSDPLDSFSLIKSDYSLIASFTTGYMQDYEIPVPRIIDSATWAVDVAGLGAGVMDHYIMLEWEKINKDFGGRDFSLSYQLYMVKPPTPDDPTEYVRMLKDIDGDTGPVASGVEVTGYDEPSSHYVRVTFKDFDPADFEDTDAYDEFVAAFGGKLRTNAVYRFFITVTAVVKDTPDDITVRSRQSPICYVTTLNAVDGNLLPPDEQARRPLAPDDFKVRKDEMGDEAVTGTSAVFEWTQLEPGTRFEIVATKAKLPPDGAPDPSDEVYTAFINYFRAYGGTYFDVTNLCITVDPSRPFPGIEYDPYSGALTYEFTEWLSPNRQYHFGIRAVRESTVLTDGFGEPIVQYSAWVSIPVTTRLIEAPFDLRTVKEVEYGFEFDHDKDAPTEEYSVRLMGPGETAFRELGRNECSIVKDGDRYYVRLYRLQPESAYSVRVFWGHTSPTLVYENRTALTRGTMHQIEVSWRGLGRYAYEMAMMQETGVEYVTLLGPDFSVRREKSQRDVGTQYYTYYATVSLIETRLFGGVTEHRPLRSNMKYQVKVRSTLTDIYGVTYSRYAGPVEARTDFDQKEMDGEDEVQRNVNNLLEGLARIEDRFYWLMSLKDRSSNDYVLKGDRIANAMRHSPAEAFVLDLTSYGARSAVDNVYAPIDLIKAMDESYRLLKVRLDGAEFTIGPETFSAGMKEVARQRAIAGTNDVFLKLTVIKANGAQVTLEGNERARAEPAYEFKAAAQGSTRRYAELRDMFHDRLWNEAEGIAAEKEALYRDYYSHLVAGRPREADKVVAQLIEEAEVELSEYVGTVVRSSIGQGSRSTGIPAFGAPMGVSLGYRKSNDLISAGVFYEGREYWRKILTNTTVTDGTVDFSVTAAGRYGVLKTDLPASLKDEDGRVPAAIGGILSKYDLSSVFPGIGSAFNDKGEALVREAILLYEKVTGSEARNAGMTAVQKARNMGLELLVGVPEVTRDLTVQEAAYVVVTLYCRHTGADINRLYPSRKPQIKDESLIADRYYMHVMIAVSVGFIDRDAAGYVHPTGGISKIGLLTAFNKELVAAGIVRADS
ncbi:MAG: hypothetical protein FWE70_01995 [Oscillospiraceae bacterium]|nr:hypothetical protein [Oscillospiraceae bacterium]